MRRLIIVALAVLIVAALLAGLLVDRASADEPGGVRFPYAELAALAAGRPVWVEAAELVSVRLRPARDWPAVAALVPGERLVATAVTPGGDPWLQVRLADGAFGWLRLAEADLSGGSVRRLPVRSAPPILAVPALNARDWPTGSPAPYPPPRWSEWTIPVLGRSADGEWVAAPAWDEYSSESPARWEPTVWLHRSEISLLAEDLELADLPLFVNGLTGGLVVLPVDPDATLDPVFVPVPDRRGRLGWQWTAGGELLISAWGGWEALTPGDGARRSVGSLRYSALAAPDGAHLATVLRREDANVDDLLITPIDGGDPVLIEAIFASRWRDCLTNDRPLPEAELSWSPDGRALLAPLVLLEACRVADRSTRIVGVDGRVVRLPAVDAPELLSRDTLPWVDWEWRPSGGVILRSERAIYVASRSGALLRTIELPEGAYGPAKWAGDNIQLIVADSGEWFAVNLENGELRPVAGMPAITHLWTPYSTQVEVQWSADGQRAAIFAKRTGELTLFDAGSMSAATVLTAEHLPDIADAIRWDARIEWSPAGDRFLLYPDPPGGITNPWPLYIIEIDPVRVSQADLVVGGDIVYPCGAAPQWSPDGELFTVHVHERLSGRAFGVDGLRTPANTDYRGEFNAGWVMIYDRAGRFVRAFRTMSGFGRSATDVSWSFDGRWLAIGEEPKGGCFSHE